MPSTFAHRGTDGSRGQSWRMWSVCERASVRVRTTYDGPRGPLPNTILAIEGIVVEMWVGERVASIVAYSRSIHCPPCHWRRARLPGRRFGVSPRGVDDIQGAEVTAVEIIYYDPSIRPLLPLVLFILLLLSDHYYTWAHYPHTPGCPSHRQTPRRTSKSPANGTAHPPPPSWQVAYVWAFITTFNLRHRIPRLESQQEYVCAPSMPNPAYTGTSLEYSLRQPVAIRPDDLLESTLICFLSNLRPALRNLKCVPSVQPSSCTPLTDTQCRKHSVLPVQLYL